ncbi:MAG: FAD-dependent oxidoreductase, partial [Sphingomonadaceae bacterium]
NAAGPWTASFLQQAAPKAEARHLRLIKGSHIIVARIFEHEHAYIFQHPDGRIVFAIPYERDFTLIGTTDLDYHGDAGQVAITPEEVAYLCELSSYYFARPVTPADVVWTYSGVRPLVEDDAADAKAVTRDYRLEVDADGGAPLLSVFGGKITTFRKLAEESVDQIAKALGNPHGHWTAQACLPGGDLFGADPQNRSVLEFDAWMGATQLRYGWLPAPLVARFCRAYGTRIHTLLGVPPADGYGRASGGRPVCGGDRVLAPL